MQFWLSSTQRAPSTPIFAGQRLAHQGFSVRYRWLFGGLKKRYFARFGELRTILGADKAKHGKRHGMKDGCMVCFWRGINAAILKISKRWGEFPDQKLRFGKGKKRPPFWQCLNWPSGWFCHGNPYFESYQAETYHHVVVAMSHRHRKSSSILQTKKTNLTYTSPRSWFRSFNGPYQLDMI